ncbi:MAG: ABC transporter ATP-binding protein, partial [Lachnospiraceae bacterium]|nr:ABC transporter ATP-binding protein [Lachnospiraceae bacterium]
MKRYAKYIKPYKAYFILGPIFMLTEVAGDVYMPTLMADIINVGAVNHDVPYILRNGALMILLAIVMMTGGILGAYFAAKASISFCTDLRFDLFKKVQTFSFRNIDSFSTGSLITRLTNDVTQVQNVIMMGLRMFLRAPGMMVGAIIMAYLMNKRLTMIFAVAIPLLAVSIA